MTVLICIEDKGGMMFNHRRLSSDRVLSERILSLCGGKKLACTPYSAPLFGEGPLAVAEELSSCMATEEFFFLENTDPESFLERAEKIILFRWNRRYPADRFFSADLSKIGYSLKRTEDFAGFSHETITQEEWVK